MDELLAGLGIKSKATLLFGNSGGRVGLELYHKNHELQISRLKPLSLAVKEARFERVTYSYFLISPQRI